MSDSQHIEHIIRDYFAAVVTGKVEHLALAANIEVSGPMQPEPLHGSEAVLEYLTQFASFVQETEILEIVIDRNSVAVRILLHTINEFEIESAFFFRIYQGQISRVRGIFDTRYLLGGGAA